jgi:hypothetical protein
VGQYRRLWPAVLLAIPACVGPTLFVTPDELPPAVEDADYRAILESEGVPSSWSITDGRLPEGLSLNGGNGVISGRPRDAGEFVFTVRVRSEGAPRRTGERTYVLNVTERLRVDLNIDDGRVGEFYSDTPQISGGTPPYIVSIVGLPGGMDYDRRTGRIFGTWQFESSALPLEMTVTDNSSPNQTETDRTTLVIHPQAVQITSTTLPPAPIDEDYSTTLAARDGRRPYSWAVTGGVLPTGLRLTLSTGVISGRPTTQSLTSTFSITVTDSDAPSSSDTESFKIVVPVEVLTATLPTAEPNVLYESTLAAGGGTRPYRWALAAGALPTGFTLDPNSGLIRGTAGTGAQTQTFTVRVTDADAPATTDDAELKLVVPVRVLTTTLPKGTIGQPYSHTLSAGFGKPPYTWAVVEGSLPAGIQLNGTTGVLSGTPTNGAQTMAFKVRVTDSDDPATQHDAILTLEIGPP